jgi:hypothetical protein
MKRLAIIISLIALIVLSTCTIALATTQNNLSVSPGKVKPGDSVSVLGSGFKAGTNVGVTFDGGGITNVNADSSGAIAFSYKLPGNLSYGTHSFTAEGDSSSKATTEPYSGPDRHVAIGSVTMDTVVKGEKVKPEPTTSTTVLGKDVKPKPIESNGEELPFTGGLPLYFGVGLGTVIAAIGYRLRK